MHRPCRVHRSIRNGLRLDRNDAALFPVGEWTAWLVPEYARKPAILRSFLP